MSEHQGTACTSPDIAHKGDIGARTLAAPAVVAAALLMGPILLDLRGQQVFRANVDHVSLDVVVTDKDEHPMVGLTRDDFEIHEHDRAQTIADFKYISVPVQAEPIDLTAPRTPPRDVATNAPSSDASRAIVVVIDEDLIANQDIVPTKRILAELLQGISPSDEAAMVYVRYSNLSQDFTNDVGQLVAAVNRMREATGFHEPKVGFGGLLNVLDNARAVLNSAPQRRKFIVFVGEASPGLAPIPVETFGKLRHAGVPIYPIDPVAMQLHMPPSIPEFKHFQMPDSFDAMAQFTGGRAVLHPGDPIATASELMAENGRYYLLGYYPDPFQRDGKFHSVTVTVKRPDVHVRAREGYWALDQPVLDAEHGLNAAIGAGLDNPGLPVALFAAPVSAVQKGVRTVVAATVTYPESVPAQLDDELRVALVAVDPDATIKAQHEFVVPVRRSSTAPGGFSVVIDDAIDLPPQPLTLRIGVTSRVHHATGTAHLKVDVPDVRHDGPELGGVIISAGENVFPPAFRLETINAVAPVQPTTTRTFGPADVLRVFAHAYWKPKVRQDTQADSVIRILDAETSRTEPLTGTLVAADRVEATVDSTIPLTGLTPGTHVLQVEVRRPGRPQAERHVVFEIR